MNRIEKLLGKGENLTLGEGENAVELEIKPLTVNDIDLIVGMGEPDKAAESTKKLMQTVLTRALPEATPEQINQISFGHFEKLMDAITRVNNLDKPDKRSKLMENVKKREAFQNKIKSSGK